MKLFPLVVVAPRGLITILLFLSILPANNINLVNKSLVIQVIVLTAIIMMLGMFFVKQHKPARIKEAGIIIDQTAESESGEI